ncbi:MAG: helix-turn-helix domain-containing protein [Deltaproteobacteria bacterium]|nr:helix-turn-helix domain-containing protein [Deltaproteobacteria bacterium]
MSATLGPDDVLTPDEAGRILKIPPKTIVQLCREGRMPTARKVGRQWRILRRGLAMLFDGGEDDADLLEGQGHLAGGDRGERSAQGLRAPWQPQGRDGVRGAHPRGARGVRHEGRTLPSRADILGLLRGHVPEVRGEGPAREHLEDPAVPRRDAPRSPR